MKPSMGKNDKYILIDSDAGRVELLINSVAQDILSGRKEMSEETEIRRDELIQQLNIADAVRGIRQRTTK